MRSILTFREGPLRCTSRLFSAFQVSHARDAPPLLSLAVNHPCTCSRRRRLLPPGSAPRSVR